MLPDFPGLKQKLQDALGARFERAVGARLGIVGRIPRSIMHEGKETLIARADGSVDKSKMVEMRTPVQFRLDEIENLSLEQLLAKLDAAAEDMAIQQARLFYERFSQAVEQAGTAVDAQGRQLSAELLFEAIERIDLDFDTSGKPEFPTLVASGDIHKRLMEVLAQLDRDRGSQEAV